MGVLPEKTSSRICFSDRWVWYNTKNVRIFLSHGFNPISLKNASFYNAPVYYQVPKWLRPKWLVRVEISSITLIVSKNSKT